MGSSLPEILLFNETLQCLKFIADIPRQLLFNILIVASTQFVITAVLRNPDYKYISYLCFACLLCITKKKQKKLNIFLVFLFI